MGEEDCPIEYLVHFIDDLAERLEGVEPHAVYLLVCDICSHECVSVIPLRFSFDEGGAECSQCGHMTMYPRDEEDD
jgi:hypothetical protein